MPGDSVQRLRELVWTAGVTAAGSALVARDRLLRWIPRGRGTAAVSRQAIPSGRETLDAVLVRPIPSIEIQAAVLICHGIGETVGHWILAQELLAAVGVASLVFNYAGCGRSTGWIGPAGCERDAISAFAWLSEAVPGVPVTLLGFSLGSGVATAVAPRLPIARLILCEAYTSFRDAVRAVGVPKFVAAMVPDVWRSVETLRSCTMPVLVVHGACDRLFPVSMGAQLAAAAGGAGELAVIPGMGHPDLHSKARPEDWSAMVGAIRGCNSGRMRRSTDGL